MGLFWRVGIAIGLAALVGSASAQLQPEQMFGPIHSNQISGPVPPAPPGGGGGCTNVALIFNTPCNSQYIAIVH